MNAKEVSIIVQRLLYEQSNIYQATNFTRRCHECDIIGITESMIVTEIEVKISRSDYLRDFNDKKAKHNIMLTLITGGFHNGYYIVPNKFYYACPEGMIKEAELPSYAGLIYVKENEAQVIKKAPRIHKGRADEETLISILKVNTERLIFNGSTYMTHKNREQRARNNQVIKDAEIRTREFIDKFKPK